MKLKDYLDGIINEQITIFHDEFIYDLKKYATYSLVCLKLRKCKIIFRHIQMLQLNREGNADVLNVKHIASLLKKELFE